MKQETIFFKFQMIHIKKEVSHIGYISASMIGSSIIKE